MSISWPVAASQTLTVCIVAGGGDATAVGAERHSVRGAGVSLERERFPAGFDVPDLDRLIVAGGGDATAVGAERHACDGVGVSLEREGLLAGAGVPDLDSPTGAARGGATSVWAERHACDGVGVSLELGVSVSCPSLVSQTLTVPPALPKRCVGRLG